MYLTLWFASKIDIVQDLVIDEDSTLWRPGTLSSCVQYSVVDARTLVITYRCPTCLVLAQIHLHMEPNRGQ
jgi:hypothetical protein